MSAVSRPVRMLPGHDECSVRASRNVAMQGTMSAVSRPVARKGTMSAMSAQVDVAGRRNSSAPASTCRQQPAL
jgi:hypothetical protein